MKRKVYSCVNSAATPIPQAPEISILPSFSLSDLSSTSSETSI